MPALIPTLYLKEFNLLNKNDNKIGLNKYLDWRQRNKHTGYSHYFAATRLAS
jgi:hypothetical protein